MNFLIIINTNHKYSGWFNLSNYLKNTILNIFPKSNVEIREFPYTSVYSSSYYHYSYKNIQIYDKYDIIFVCEGRPSKIWSLKGKIIWIPCQEFLGGAAWRFMKNTFDYWYEILIPSKFAFDRIKLINNNIPLKHIQIWQPPINKINPIKYKTNNLKLFLHLRSRGINQEFITEILKKIKNIEIIIKTDYPTIDLIDINSCNISSIIFGRNDNNEQYINNLLKSDMYLVPRIFEGIGLCVQDACSCGNYIFGTDYTTFNEYFDNKNGTLLKCKKCQNDYMPSIMGEKFYITIEENQEKIMIDKINYFKNNIQELRDIQEYNYKYCIDKHEKFKQELFEYLNNKIERTENKNKKIKISHIQLCLEGGQGLGSITIAGGHKKYHNYDIDFYYMSNSPDSIETSKYIDKLNKYNIKHKKIEDINEIDKDSDIIFLHWCSVAYKRINNINKIYEDIKKIKSLKIGFIHDSVEIMPDICDYYCVGSNFNKKFSPNINKTFVIPYPIENCFYEYIEKNNYKKSSVIIGRVSRLIKRKFHDNFVPILKYLSNKNKYILSTIIGNGPFENELIKSFNKYNLEHNIIKNIYDENRVGYIADFDMCLYLTSEHEESFGMSIAECMALGVPVVCENKGALKETVGDGGFVCDSFYEIIEKCEDLIRKPELKKEISKKAKLKAENYREINVSILYDKLFKKLLNKNNEYLWSIIMPVYNSELYIRNSIESVLNQTYSNFELIIIDDNSNDNTKKIISNINNNKIKYIELKDGPHSQGYCWNIGIKESNGDFIGFVDSDDWIYPNAIEEMNNFYKTNDVIFAYSNNERYDKELKNKTLDGFSEDPYKYGSLIDGMLTIPGVIVSHFITCKKQFVEKIDFSNCPSTSCDKWLALKMDMIGKLGFLNKVLYKYRYMRDGSVTTSKRQSQIINTENIINEALKERKDKRRIKLICQDNNFNYDIIICSM
jgi:glycosyltransferase involved in cell wall biosynthesis